mmetsp:Transcript_3878/g.11588  ORF Transcript_3878/g.11588 Transcript_3878/m.11588 type:complete len:308 (+) Transcript_3878:3419-4342(+)
MEENEEVLVYHEQQVSYLCGVHALNALLQGEFFTEFELAKLARSLDEEEQRLTNFNNIESSNVSNDGNFSLQVLSRALDGWGMECSLAGGQDLNCLSEKAFICHLGDHWFCLRRIEMMWFDLNSLQPGPKPISDFYLDAYLASLRGQGYYIFVIRGNFPNNKPMRGTNTTFGKWWRLPEIEALKTQGAQISSNRMDAGDDAQDLQRAIEQSLAEQSDMQCDVEEDPELAEAIKMSLVSDVDRSQAVASESAKYEGTGPGIDELEDAESDNSYAEGNEPENKRKLDESERAMRPESHQPESHEPGNGE